MGIVNPCESNSTSCILHCIGDVSESGEVSYGWRFDPGGWRGPSANETRIYNDKEGRKVKTFSCEVRNEFSVEQSDPVRNLFYEEGM